MPNSVPGTPSNAFEINSIFLFGTSSSSGVQQVSRTESWCSVCYQFRSPEGSMFHDDQPYPVIFRYVVLLVNSSHWLARSSILSFVHPVLNPVLGLAWGFCFFWSKLRQLYDLHSRLASMYIRSPENRIYYACSTTESYLLLIPNITWYDSLSWSSDKSTTMGEMEYTFHVSSAGFDEMLTIRHHCFLEKYLILFQTILHVLARAILFDSLIIRDHLLIQKDVYQGKCSLISVNPSMKRIWIVDQHHHLISRIS